VTIDSPDQPALVPMSLVSPQTAQAPAPLFYVAGATDGTLQCKAESFQLVNWGGFEGRSGSTFIPARR
jgi:hypothetical protein